MTALWYWLIVWCVVAVFLGVPIGAWLERREERRDREAWSRVSGGITTDEFDRRIAREHESIRQLIDVGQRIEALGKRRSR